ncbi:hypothetical protein JCM14036_16440 [Desulfotomaculum defluvii]
MKFSDTKNVPPVISLVGSSNSGKTTFLEKLLHQLKNRGYRVGTVKHHRGTFELDIEGKDTWRHRQAGAEMVALSTPTGFGLIKNLDQEMSLAEILHYFSGLDLVIVEGYKRGSQPKIELARAEVANGLVLPTEELLAVISDLPLDLDIPLFDLNDITGVAKLIENKFLQLKKKTAPSSLSAQQKERYNRNIMLPGVGEEGQLKLLNSSVLVVGTGGLGSPVIYYLAAAGIGRLGLADADVVDYSNLQRQIVHSTPDIGRLKVESAREKLSWINPDTEIITYPYRINDENILELLDQYDIVVDATDNLESRYVLNKACITKEKPFIYGGVLSMVGQAMTILPGKGPCFRCIFRQQPTKGSVKGTAEVGILGSVAGIIGSIQATEAVKFLLGKEDLLVGRMLTMDALSMSFVDVEVKRDLNCPECGQLI